MAGNFIAAAVNNASDIPAWFVVCMGIGTVCVGLVFIILICQLVSLFFRNGKSENSAPLPKKTETALSDEERGKVIAAVCAAAAEDMGTDISALRVVSFKKL